MDKEPFDPIRPWFEAAEDLGEFIGIRFGRIAPGTTEPEWIYLSHKEFDGIGGFAKILRERGAKLGRLPQVRHPAESSKLAVLKLLPKFLQPRRRLKWAPFDGKPVPSSNDRPPLAVSWHVFDEAETLRIRRVCRKAGVTVNSFLMKNLSKAIRSFLEDPSSVVPWMILVNLRGKVFRNRDTENHSSYISIKIRSYETVHDVHRKIYATLARKEHWANWYAFIAARLTTHGMRKYMLENDLATSSWNIGGFSNLGDWDPEKEINADECLGNWLFSPPLLRSQKVGAGCVTFQNRLSLVIQTHPELNTNPDVTNAWMQNWVKEIEFDVNSGIEDPAIFA
ncbi:MAG TPA: hypothetical protein VH280_07750 [Verrucomicrobiae bacterium]|jgi:NRPS condensation-like uncharacterized protein|nr:hypothetical protein [Verrucomicrobiae bacterium]